MEWSMRYPEFKVNMFRLVDVLPSLQKASSLAQHINEYLSESAKKIHGLLEWGVNVSPHSLRAKASSFLIRKIVNQMASQFIAGADPKSAAKVLHKLREEGLAYTVDLLGEYCLSYSEAEEYLNRYLEALDVLYQESKDEKPIVEGHIADSSPVNVSVKLTALYPHCSPVNFKKSVEALSEKLSVIVEKAKQINAGLYIDAEDTQSNPIIYEVFKRVFSDSRFKDFPLPGVVVQAYCKDSKRVLEDLLSFAREQGRKIALRLVKGAYWDTETALANQKGWPVPVFQDKRETDKNYEELTAVLLENIKHCVPAFGSHNIRSLSYACCLADKVGVSKREFELQMLYGMAEPIAKAFQDKGYLVRMYVPLGELIPGMGYLVRRLLENTANESFLRHTFYDKQEVENLLRAV